jgi:hypothetical protein
MIEGKKLYATEIKKIGALAEVAWFFLATSGWHDSATDAHASARRSREVP